MAGWTSCDGMVDLVILLITQLILFLSNVAGVIMIQRSKRLGGWIVLIANSLMWIVYAMITRQFVFVVSSIIYLCVFVRGAIVDYS